MKQLLLLILTFFSLQQLQAQFTLEVSPENLDYNLQTDLTYEFSEPIAHAWVINTSDDTVNLRWMREIIGPDCPAQWKYRICDDTACYSSNTSSNVIFGGGLFAPVPLPPGDSTILDIHVIPNTVAGCCKLRINLSHVVSANLDEPITSVDVNICISPEVSVSERDRLSLRVYPNPTSDYFTLTRNNFIKHIYVTNVLGKRVKSFRASMGGKYDISELPDGIYMVSMLGDNNRVVKTVRISKRSPRP
ncbi:MAG: hypothetical protein RI973_1203 [Bacteroidota bacterium]|jgi:hypothetical protein